MKIILDEVKKDGVLINKDGEEVSRYSYKNIINEIDEFMPELVCPNCRAKFEYKKTDDR